MSSDAELAFDVATRAGEVLTRLRAESSLQGKELGAAGDREAETLISAALKAARPEDGYLSEESAPDPGRLGKRRVWIIDPLDGTREYSEPGRTDWAVHVALTLDGRPEVGAVVLPAMGLIFGSVPPPTLPAPATKLRIVVSRTRPPELAAQVAANLDGELVGMGSAGAKAMAVVRGEAEAYLHAGGQYEWDSCAPVAVALAAGLHASRLDGSACLYNRVDPAMPDLLICRPEWADRLLAAIRDAH